MTAIRQPRSIKAATALCERYAVLADEIGAIEAKRNAMIADANARADRAVADLVTECDDIAMKLKPWWSEHGGELTAKVGDGTRKSIELGGCMIGSRAGRSSLAVVGKEADVVDVLAGLRWAKPFLRVKTTLNRPALMAAAGGNRKVALAEIGITRTTGDEQFYIERAEQAGTIGRESR